MGPRRSLQLALIVAAALALGLALTGAMLPMVAVEAPHSVPTTR